MFPLFFFPKKKMCIFNIQFKSQWWRTDAHRYRRQCSQVPCPARTVGPSARLCSGCHWNMEQSCHRRCGRGLSRADWQPLPSYLSLMQGPYRAAPARTHTFPRWRSKDKAIKWLLHFIREKEAVTTPWWEDYRGSSAQIEFSRKPSTPDRFNYPGLPKRDMSFKQQRRADVARKNK